MIDDDREKSPGEVGAGLPLSFPYPIPSGVPFSSCHVFTLLTMSNYSLLLPPITNIPLPTTNISITSAHEL